jgi:hypothetical protein
MRAFDEAQGLETLSDALRSRLLETSLYKASTHDAPPDSERQP